MPKQTSSSPLQQGLVSTIFNDFLAALPSKSGVGASIIERLRVTLLEEQGLSAEAMRTALFGR